MKVKVILEKGLDGSYDARMTNDKLDFMLLGQGNTVQEAIEDFYESNKEMKELYEDENKNYPIFNFEFVYDIVSFLEYYSNLLSYAALERITGISQVQLNQYVQGYRNPSKKTSKKIESKFHEFAKELNQVQFV